MVSRELILWSLVLSYTVELLEFISDVLVIDTEHTFVNGIVSGEVVDFVEGSVHYLVAGKVLEIIVFDDGALALDVLLVLLDIFMLIYLLELFFEVVDVVGGEEGVLLGGDSFGRLDLSGDLVDLQLCQAAPATCFNASDFMAVDENSSKLTSEILV